MGGSPPEARFCVLDEDLINHNEPIILCSNVSSIVFYHRTLLLISGYSHVIHMLHNTFHDDVRDNKANCH